MKGVRVMILKLTSYGSSTKFLIDTTCLVFTPSDSDYTYITALANQDYTDKVKETIAEIEQQIKEGGIN